MKKVRKDDEGRGGGEGEVRALKITSLFCSFMWHENKARDTKA